MFYRYTGTGTSRYRIFAALVQFTFCHDMANFPPGGLIKDYLILGKSHTYLSKLFNPFVFVKANQVMNDKSMRG